MSLLNSISVNDSSFKRRYLCILSTHARVLPRSQYLETIKLGLKNKKNTKHFIIFRQVCNDCRFLPPLLLFNANFLFASAVISPRLREQNYGTTNQAFEADVATITGRDERDAENDDDERNLAAPGKGKKGHQVFKV